MKLVTTHNLRYILAGLVALGVVGECLAATAEKPQEFSIRVNPAGYLPAAAKVCFMKDPPLPTFVVQKSATDVRWHTVYEGQWTDAGGGVMKGDFSSLREPGDYRVLCVPQLTSKPLRMHARFPGQQSYHFPIRKDVYDTVERLFLLYINWQRCGSCKGWAGLCHQDSVPLLDAAGKKVGTLDARGGYHQSCDLRNWHDGISMSMYALLRYAELKKPLWDTGELADEIKWGCAYLLKVISPEGYVYDAQFAPIGWGPRHYYVAPATLGAQCNCAILFARAARFFRTADPAYAARLTAASQRLWRQIEEHPFFATAQPAPEKDLPPGSQPAEKCYPQQYRTSVNGYAERAMVALELFRTTGDPALAKIAQQYGGEMLKHLITAGDEAGYYRDAKGKDGHAFTDWSYCWRISGYRTTLELWKEFKADTWRAATLCVADRIMRSWQEANIAERRGTSTAAAHALYLHEVGKATGQAAYCTAAQRAFDWIFGVNKWNRSFVEGVGQNQWQRPVFGQFFPSTPQIPGGILHVTAGEYDMPPVAFTLWASATLAR